MPKISEIRSSRKRVRVKVIKITTITMTMIREKRWILPNKKLRNYWHFTPGLAQIVILVMLRTSYRFTIVTVVVLVSQAMIH